MNIPFYQIIGANSNDDKKNMNHEFDNTIMSYLIQLIQTLHQV